MSRVGIVVISAIMVEIISVVQYQRIRRGMLSEMDQRSRIVLSSISDDIGHALEITETTMNENLWEVRRQLSNPDSVYTAIEHIIDDNPHITGGCMAFVPDYYPSMGRLFEPYVSKGVGVFVKNQLASSSHDYTVHEAWRRVMDSGRPVWSDPYVYGPDSLKLITYSYPIIDSKGRLAAVCGLDMDLEWLGDTLNARHHFPSSFRLLLTGKGELVAGPSSDRIPPQEVRTMVDIISGKVPSSDQSEYVFKIESMKRQPYWQVVQVYKKKEIYEGMNRMRRQQMIFVLLGLAILAFMINRYARSEQKLHLADEDNARIGGELRVASEIQQSMLPPAQMHLDDVEVSAALIPAREVGGDLFDYFMRDGKLFFCIGDVSGKGAASAMLMAVMHSLFRAFSDHENNPSNIMRAINENACKGNQSNMFVTLFIGVLDLPTGELQYCNAGHDCPLVLAGKEVRGIEAPPHLPLGVFPDVNYKAGRYTLEAGSTLFLYTDGLTEAKNSTRAQFGLSRVKETLGDVASTAPAEVLQAISDSLKGFVADAPQSDDLTLMAIRYTPRPFESVLDASLTLKNEVREVTALSAFMKENAEKLQLEHRLAQELRLAVEEVVVNVIDYAYPPGIEGEVSVQITSDGKTLQVKITDRGVPFDPTAVRKADTSLSAEDRRIGGLGILLVRSLMDTVNYLREDGQNILTLTKKYK